MMDRMHMSLKKKKGNVSYFLIYLLLSHCIKWRPLCIISKLIVNSNVDLGYVMLSRHA